MEGNEIYHELFKDSEERFKKHVEIPNNERIIFSGKFGHGKTTFLREFFKEEKQKELFGRKKYNVISLFPVNYSVATTQDIFRYIKYDIVIEMQEQGYNLSHYTISCLKTLPLFLQKNAHKVLAAIIHMIPKVGKDIIESYKEWDKLKDEFFEYHDKIIGSENKGDQLIKYIEHFEKTEGSIFEDDIVTKLIESILSEQKIKDEVDETILLIDDLDRIDPEHIFRILNVFAAHFDRRNSIICKNKFGFDKVIVVCDIENVRNIFKAKFGIDVDFNGYIDKFYSQRVFEYNCENGLLRFISKFIFLTQWRNTDSISRNSMNGSDFNLINSNAQFLQQICVSLFHSGQMDLRNIKQIIHETHSVQHYIKISFVTLRTEDVPLLIHLYLIYKILGGYSAFINAIPKIDMKFSNVNMVEHISTMLYLLARLQNNGDINEDKEYLIDMGDKTYTISFSNTRARYPDILYVSPNDVLDFKVNHFTKVLQSLVLYLGKHGYFK